MVTRICTSVAECQSARFWATFGALGGAIEDLRRRLYLVAAGLASVRFAVSTEADLLDWACDEGTRRRLRAIVDRDIQLKRSAVV